MKAYELGDRKDGRLTLRKVDRPDPRPGFGEAVVRIHATGLGARDIRIMKSALPADGRSLPNRPSADRIPLQDSAGQVIAIGEGVTRVKVGDRVMATHYPRYIDGRWDAAMFDYDFGNICDGFLAEQSLLPAEALVRIPDSLTYEQASTLQSSGLTPWRALVVDGRTLCGETVMILGAGNVSVFGLQIARMMGARVAISSSSDEKLARLREMGADITINYRSTPDWHTELLAQTDGEGADVVLNSVGFGETERSLLACAANGRVMLVGVAEDDTALRGFPNMIRKDLMIGGFTVGSRRMFEDFVRAVEVNRMTPLVDRVFAFDEIYEAIDYYEQQTRLGKVVIRIQ